MGNEAAKQQKIKAQQLEDAEQHVHRLKKLLGRDRDTPLALEDRNRWTGPLALEDVDSIGVRRRTESKVDPAQEELLKNKIKTVENKLVLSQKATAEAEAEIESTQNRLNTTIKDFQECRRKNELVLESLAKQEQREHNVRADL